MLLLFFVFLGTVTISYHFVVIVHQSVFETILFSRENPRMRRIQILMQI